MADTTTPVTPPAQDLQINLEDVTEQSEGIPQGGTPKEATAAVTEPANTQPELNLDLDLNLPDAPKNDDRLKNEDQKNQEAVTPVVEQPEVVPVVEQSTVETPVLEPIDETVTIEPIAEIPAVEIPVIETPVIENKIEDIVVPTPEVTPEPVETSTEEIQPVTEVEQPSTIITQEPITTEAPAELKEDMAIINDLESHASAGGLAPEANVEIQPTPTIEKPKTFDLDAMLGTPPPAPIAEKSHDSGEIEEGVVAEAQPIPTPSEQKTEIPQTITTAETQVPPPAFVIPTPETQVPVQAVTQVIIPHNKTKGIKTLLFVVLFTALGFTTYFILKTMYPLEFANIFGENDTQMHASEDIVAETGMVDELSGATELLTGEEMTGTTEETSFGELNDLGTTTEETTIESEQTDLSRLTDYVNKGNELLEQGKAINNNTVIKYGLYISKKATDFLEKIANGEEISNVSGYFAQFDQYIVQLEGLIGTTGTTTPEISTPEIITSNQETSASPETTHDTQDMTPTPEATSE